MSGRKTPVEKIDCIVERVTAEHALFEAFASQVETVISRKGGNDGHIHSIKKRLKSPASLAEKIQKKRNDGDDVTSENVFKKIYDISGVRVIHLFPQDIVVLDQLINSCINDLGWHLAEKPKAYSWDPESVKYLQGLGLRCYLKPSYYTSVHYIVKPNKKGNVSCEIQVRSLLEEVWAEVDHKVKYKRESVGEREREHLAVLARIVSAGSKIVSSLHA